MPQRFPTKLLPNARDYDQAFFDDLSRIDLFHKMAGWLIQTSKMITHGDSRDQRWHNLSVYLMQNKPMFHGDVRTRVFLTAEAIEDISEKWRTATAKHCNLFFTQQLEWFVNTKVGELFEQVKAMEESRKIWVKNSEQQSYKADRYKQTFLLFKRHVQELMDKVKIEMKDFRVCCYSWIKSEKDFDSFVVEKLKDVAQPPPDAYYEEMFAWKKEKQEKRSDKVMRKKGVSSMLKPDASSKSNKSDKSNKSSKSGKSGKLVRKLKDKKDALKKKLGELKYMIGGADEFKKSKKEASRMGKADSKMGQPDSKMANVGEVSSMKGKSKMDRVDSSKGKSKMSKTEEGSAE